MNATSSQDPIEFVRSLWNGVGFSMPGMVAPTFNTDELEKRITDLKAVEGWLRMNLSMLQMTIQGLEVQQTTLSTVEAVSKIVGAPSENGAAAGSDENEPTMGETLQRAVLWPWNAMQHMQEKIQQHLQEAQEAQAAQESKQKSEAKTSTVKKTSAHKTAASSGKPAPRKTTRKNV